MMPELTIYCNAWYSLGFRAPANRSGERTACPPMCGRPRQSPGTPQPLGDVVRWGVAARALETAREARALTGLRSFHRQTLGEIARFIDVAAKLDRKMVGKKLKRDDRQDRHYAIERFWQGNNFVGNVFELLRAVPAGERNDRTLTSFDLLDVIHVFREDRIVGHDKDRGKIRTN